MLHMGCARTVGAVEFSRFCMSCPFFPVEVQRFEHGVPRIHAALAFIWSHLFCPQVLWVGGNDMVTDKGAAALETALKTKKTLLLELWVGESQVSDGFVTTRLDPIIEENRNLYEARLEEERERERERVVEEAERREEARRKESANTVDPSIVRGDTAPPFLRPASLPPPRSARL